MRPFERAAAAVGPPDARAAAACRARWEQLAMPAGALARIGDLAARLAGIAGTDPPPSPAPAAVLVFAGDHGVAATGVTPWPSSVTTAMAATAAAGGAAVAVLARTLGASLTVVDVGLAGPPAPGVLDRRVRSGTADLATGPALDDPDVDAALDVGAEVTAGALAAGARCVVPGDLGIGNTTSSAAVVAALTGAEPAAVTGRGTGVDDDGLRRKVAAVTAGVRRWRERGADHRRVLAEVGGLELAAMAGAFVAAAAGRVPAVVDGVVAAAALLAAEALVPGTAAFAVAGHRSSEPGAPVALGHLGLEPLLDLGLRLGEGTGALLALPLLQQAAALAGQMATIDEALGRLPPP